TPSSIASILVMVIVFMALGSLIGSEVDDSMATQSFGYVNLDTDVSEDSYSLNAIDDIRQYYIDQDLDPDEYMFELPASALESDEKKLAAMNDAGIDTLIIFNSDFSYNIGSWEPGATAVKRGQITVIWNQTDTGVFSSLSTVTATTMVALINSSVSETLIIDNSSMDETDVAYVNNPVTLLGYSTFLNGQAHENVTPTDIYSAMSTQTMFVPIIIMLVIIMIGSILISSMGNEKENKTLETLLTLPVKRTTIVSGKLVGSAIAGLVMGALYMVGMYFYIDGLSGVTSTGVTMESLGLTLSTFDWIIVMVFMFLAILCALGICMILGAFAKNYKAAQTYIMPVSVLAMIPMFVTMFTSFDALPAVLQAAIFAIPFSHPMMIMQNLMFDNTAMIISGLVYLMIFAATMIYITVRLYKSDILLTGLMKKKHKFGKISFKNKGE
ncbi:MAG: ABC transporter permease, partial [Candidatus Methanomethylophilaceae archaeon]